MFYNIGINFAKEENGCNFAIPKGNNPDAKTAERLSGLQDIPTMILRYDRKKITPRKIYKDNKIFENIKTCKQQGN